MDRDRFDNLTRLAATASRRAVLRALAGAAGGGLLGRQGRAAAQQGSCAGGTCTGCCNDSGACLAGTSDTGCGANGGPCVICDPGKGLTCQNGVCLCPGCDPGPGEQCASGLSSDAFCGVGGVPCVSCPAPLKCDQGVCRPCGSGNCAAGCCGANGCEGGRTDGNCGWKGQQCVACRPGQQCIAVNRSNGVEQACACTRQSCRGGCCDPWANLSTLEPTLGGVCHPGNTPQHCGNDGQQCKKCPPGQTCVNGQCVTQVGMVDLPYVPHVPDGFAVDGGIGNAGASEFVMGGVPLPADLPVGQTYGHRSLRRDEEGQVDQQFVTFVFTTPSGDDAAAALDRLFDAYPDAQPVAGGDADRAGQFTYAGRRDDGSPFAGRGAFGSIGDIAFVADLMNPLSDATPGGEALDEAVANVNRNATRVQDGTSPGSFGEDGIPLVDPAARWFGSYTERDNCLAGLALAPGGGSYKRAGGQDDDAGAPCDYAHLAQWAPGPANQRRLLGGLAAGPMTNQRSAGMPASALAASGQTEPARVEYFDGWIRRFANPDDAAADFQALPGRLEETSSEGHVNIVVQVDEADQFRVVGRLPLPNAEVAVFDAHLRGETIVGANIFSRPLGEADVPEAYYQALHVALDAYQALFACAQPCEPERASLDEALRALAEG